MSERRKSLFVSLFFAALILVGLLTAGDYGLPCDEPAEQVILQENLKEYAVRLLGNDSDAVRFYDAQGIQRITQSIERDHGQAAYYPAALLLRLADSAPDRMTAPWHGYTWLWFMAGVYALYCLARSLGLSRPLACAAALLLYLSPRFFAEGHYNNKDVVLLSLMLCTLASGARFLRKPGYAVALAFSLFGALATNTKIIGVFGWGLVGLAALVSWTARRELTAKRVRVGLVAIGSFAAIYALLTPALWADPLGYFPYVLSNAAGFSRWTGVVIYRGFAYDPTRDLPLPRSYLPGMIALTVPLGTLLLAVVGQARALARCARGDERRPMLVVLTLLWLTPLVYVVLARPLLYNGWRHFYFVYAAIAGMGAFGLQVIADALRASRPWRRAGAVALGLMLAAQATGIALNHPYQYAYYNALASEPETRFELDYWDVSTVNAMRRLCASEERDERLPLTLGSRDDMSWFGVSHGYAVLSAQERARLTVAEDADAPYLFYNTTYALIYGVAPPEGYHALFSLSGYGNTLCTVYERDQAR